MKRDVIIHEKGMDVRCVSAQRGRSLSESGRNWFQFLMIFPMAFETQTIVASSTPTRKDMVEPPRKQLFST